MTADGARVRYLADIRFPIERANGIQTIETCHALARAGLDVTLVARSDTHDPPRDPLAFYGLAPHARLTLRRLALTGSPAARRARFLSTALTSALERDTDVIFTRDLLLASLLLGVPRRLRPPVIYESHGMADRVAADLHTRLSTATAASPAKLQRLARRDARVWRRADGYVTITARLHEALTSTCGHRSRVVVAHDGVRRDDIVADEDRAPSRPLVVTYAGNLFPWKGVDVFVDALARVAEVRGVVVGGHPSEPDLERLRALADRLGVADRLTFTGMVAPRAVPAHLAAADVLVLPNLPTTISSDFSSPLKLFEYLAAGRAIVASDLPAFREVVVPDETALLVEAGNAEALAAALRRLAAEPHLVAGLGRQARVVASNYTWDARAATLAALIDDVLGRSQHDVGGSGGGPTI